MAPESSARWSPAALLASLGLHALVAFGLWVTPERTLPTSTNAALTWVDATPAPTPAPPPPPAPPLAPVAPAEPSRKPTPPRRVPGGRPTPGPPDTAPSTAGPALDDRPLASTGEGPVVRSPATRPSLTPGSGFVMQLPEASDAEDTRGTTLRNDPRDLPDRQAVAEYEAERAGRRLSLDLATDVARAQQGAGRLPGFFSSASRSLAEAAEREPVQVSKASERGQTLNAIGSVIDPTRSQPTGTAVNRVAETAFVQNATRMGNPALPGDQQAFNQAVAQGFTRLETIRDNLSAARLRTVVALTTDPRGVLAEAAIEERSGDRTFDESALHLSRKVMRTLPDSDDKQLGTSWWRSRWVFTWEPPRMKVRLLDATPLPPPLE